MSLTTTELAALTAYAATWDHTAAAMGHPELHRIAALREALERLAEGVEAAALATTDWADAGRFAALAADARAVLTADDTSLWPDDEGATP